MDKGSHSPTLVSRQLLQYFVVKNCRENNMRGKRVSLAKKSNFERMWYRAEKTPGIFGSLHVTCGVRTGNIPYQVDVPQCSPSNDI
jgi:hypothetical protein